MIYLSSFSMPTVQQEERFYSNCRITNITTVYPFEMFCKRGLPEAFEFGDITIFCGNNGSGKSTILNVIAEKLELDRTAPFNRSELFDNYVNIADYELEEKIPQYSSVVTSDDVFEKVLDIRRINDGISRRKDDLIDQWVANRSPDADSHIHGFDDFKRWKDVADARDKRKSQTQYIRNRLMRNLSTRSNGESALALFVDAIQDDGLYLLDEPENSLSPSNQLELKYFLEDCVKNHGCQFIISTHSPFLLSLNGARIYDLDSVPMKVRKWTELECVKVYQQFFEEKSFLF
ncbi:MAG: AAA family ATPase [Clostridia bacterium]|nr:AAA family ATPase [Clostridia bacterium]